VKRGGRVRNPRPAGPRSRAALRFAQAARTRAKRVAARRSGYLRWLPPQYAFLRDPSKRKLLRLGNQWGGKTTAGLTEVDWRCTGKHPFLDTHQPPIEAWVVCASWSQSVAIQQKFWQLCDRDELDPRTVFDPVKGFRGKNPVVRYKNGSLVKFKTTRQGGLQLASATIHVALIDEPTSPRVYQELQKRVSKTNGVLIMTLTPINGPVDYLRELAEAGAVQDHHYPLKPEFLIPVGSDLPLRLEDGTPMDADWCERTRAETLSMEEPVIVDGEWEVRVTGRLFTAFDSNLNGAHVTANIPTGDLKLCVGIDHGQKDFKQVAVLVGVDISGEHPKVHILNEYVGPGDTLPEQDARGILDMLATPWGFRWEDVTHARGDKPYDGAGKRLRVIRKSNQDLEAALRKILRIGPRGVLSPPIRQAKTGEGGGRASIDAGCTWLHRAMLRPGHFTVHPRCTRLIEALDKWDFTDSDFKDPVDALRYATWSYAIRGRHARATPTLYVY
jgi:phage terminase large subunit-like protein